MSLKVKILLTTVIPALILAAMITGIFVVNFFSMGTEVVMNHRENLLEAKKQELAHYMEIAINAIQGKTRTQAMELLRQLRYGDDGQGYFWINDTGSPYPIMLMHPAVPGLEGKIMDDPQWNKALDKQGRPLNIFTAFHQVCLENGHGYVDYVWPKPTRQGLTEDLSKTSYVYLYREFGWIIGTGVYIDEIDNMAALEQTKINKTILKLLIYIGIISLVLIVLFILLVFFLMQKYVTRQIYLIEATLKDFNNDLTKQVPIVSSDEIGSLARWFNEHITGLHDTIGNVQNVSRDVTVSADEIAVNVEKYASFSTQLMTSIVEISSTMEEFSATATQIAEHSANVVNIAGKSLEETRQGAEAVQLVTSKMEEINQYSGNNIKAVVELGGKSKEITKIMEFINEIANQTKLIAFNAALEAAGAGEAGKRFSVVAVEIRRLAENVVQSTAEIEEKINEILSNVNNMVISAEKSTSVVREGLAYSQQTSVMINSIVDGAETTSSAARQISLSTQQQQSAGKQVVAALNDIKNGCKEGTQAVHRIHAISADLQQLSESMMKQINRFTLNT